MSLQRKDDPPAGGSRFRSERVVHDGNRWYFLTREGAMQGPFECEADALEQLDVYIRLAVNDLLLEEADISL